MNAKTRSKPDRRVEPCAECGTTTAVYSYAETRWPELASEPVLCTKHLMAKIRRTR